MRGFSVRAVALAIALSFSINAFAQQTTIQFWHYFGGDHIKTMKELIAEFEKQNPGIKVEPVFQGRPPDLRQKLEGAFATSPANNPVLSTVYENWTSDFHAKGYMDAVQDHFSGTDALSQQEQDDIVKVFREANTIDGKMVTMPFNKSIYVYYFNADRLAKAGFTTAPKTREEFKQAVTKMTEAEGNRVRTYGFGVAPLSEAFSTHYYAAGGEYFDKDGKFTINTPEAQAVLTMMRELQYPKKHLYVSTDYMDAPFGNQQIASYIYSSASFPYNARSVGDRFKWDVAPIPGVHGKEPRYLMQGTNIGIFKNRPEAERKAAWKLLKFLTNTKNSVYWETRTGYMPIRYSVLQEPEMQQYMKDNPRYATASGLVLSGKGKQEPKMAVWEGIRQDLDAMVNRVLSSARLDVAAELAATEKRANDRLQRAAKR
jgi:multiple sugar transport system substrate-binding protein